ncbi:MAG: MBL fold metallo-hydrolase [Sedimentibacter sp.]|uniref:MBL fold metallo-hydrolase n=1 Tax=Sedimentibacter sp. TaxID=1960295 RepID=UPI0031585559
MNKESITKVVMLGTGTPNPVPERSGPSVAIVVNDNSYLVDFGTGIVRQAERANQKGIRALEAKNLKTAFLTHAHSDHTLGLADLIFTPWVLEREDALKIFGPKGLKKMVDHVVAAYEDDINARMFGLEQANSTGIEVKTTEIEEGIVYQDELVTVEAFLVDHPPFEAFGYRFTTPDKVIVVSGDTCYNTNLIEHAKNCDILIHEVISSTGVQLRDPKWKKYHLRVHTTSKDLAKVAAEANPGKLVFYHQLFMVAPDETGRMVTEAEREEEMINDVKAEYKGTVISARDLDIIT